MRELRWVGLAVLALSSVPLAGVAALPDEQVLEEVIVVAKRRMPLQSAPAAVTILDQQFITRTLSGDIRDLVRHEPGVSVRNDPVRFGLDSFAIRGIGGDRVASEIDGIGVAESFAVGTLADSGRVFTDLDFIQRVEILRGPASALYGSDALGGVIHFQTLDPRDLLGPERDFSVQARAGYRGATDGWSATVLGAGSAGASEMLLGYVRRENHAADIAGGPAPNPRDSRSDQVLAKLLLPDLAAGPLEIAIEAGRTRDATRVNALLGLPPRFVNTIAMRGNDTAEHLRLSLSQALERRTAWFDAAVVRLHAQWTDTEQITRELRRAATVAAAPLELQRAFVLADEAAGAEFTASKELTSGRWSHALVYGIEVDVGRVEEQRRGLERNLNTGAVRNVILGEVFPLRDFPITERLESGVYVQDELRLGESRWRFTPGLRFDWYRLRPREDRIYREDNPVARPVQLDEHSLTPKLAIAYAFGEHSSAFLQYARGFRSPPFEDVNIGLEIPLFNHRAIPNPDLEPETSDGFELGMRTRQGAWRASASAHYTQFRDFIESRVNLGIDPLSGVTLFQSRNIERARIYGLELDARLDAAALVPTLRGWSVGLATAWARGENTAANQPLNAIEPLKGTLTIQYDAPSSWGARLAATAAASKDRLAAGPVELFRTDGYLVLEAFGYFQLGARGSINIGLGNLTNERYIEWIDVRGRAADDPLVPYARHAGRNASITLNWSFD